MVSVATCRRTTAEEEQQMMQTDFRQPFATSANLEQKDELERVGLASENFLDLPQKVVTYMKLMRTDSQSHDRAHS